jgi:cellulose biosynthesis protein BcsQ
MTTTIIAFVSQKGGVGKSTLSRALAREAAAGGLTVKIADLDTQQGTSADWNRIRLNARIEPVLAVEAFATATQALRVADHYNLLIIDGPARTSSGTLEIAKIADLVVQPTGASVDDLRLPCASSTPSCRPVFRRQSWSLPSTVSERRLRKARRAPIWRRPVTSCSTAAC